MSYQHCTSGRKLIKHRYRDPQLLLYTYITNLELRYYLLSAGHWRKEMQRKVWRNNTCLLLGRMFCIIPLTATDILPKLQSCYFSAPVASPEPVLGIAYSFRSRYVNESHVTTTGLRSVLTHLARGPVRSGEGQNARAPAQWRWWWPVS